MMDVQVIERFNQFKENTEYADLNLNQVEFELKPLIDVNILFKKGKTPKYSKTQTSFQVIKSGMARGYYNQFNFQKRYFLDNSKMNNTDERNLKKGDILINTTGKGTAGRVTLFDLDGDFVADSHIAIFRVEKENFDSTYFLNFFIQFGFENLEGMATGSGGQIELPLDKVGELKIPIPKDLNEKYTSLKIQQALVTFIEYYQKREAQQIALLDLIMRKLEEMERLVLPLFFEKDEIIRRKFERFCNQNEIHLKLDEIQFETKRILSDDKNEVICKKRMGFTPKRVNSGNIPWFTVGDLTSVEGLFINEDYSTKQKTTMNLVEKKISKKSEKYTPIQKDDVLVSFKLTVGEVKIYNSKNPAYCNEAIDILTVNPDILPTYLAYQCIIEYPKYGTRTNNGVTLNDDDKRKISIHVPQELKGFSSLKIQEFILDFLNSYFEKINELKHLGNNLKNLIHSYTQTLIYKIFNEST